MNSNGSSIVFVFGIKSLTASLSPCSFITTGSSVIIKKLSISEVLTNALRLKLPSSLESLSLRKSSSFLSSSKTQDSSQILAVPSLLSITSSSVSLLDHYYGLVLTYQMFDSFLLDKIQQ